MANSPFSFQLQEARQSHLEFMSWETPRFWVGILAWCLIVNNVYLIAVPEDERDFARAIREANKRYCRTQNFAKGETRAETA